MGLLSDADEKLLPAAMRQNGGFHLAAQWYLRGWEPLWYQYYFHQAAQPNSTWLAGIAVGKTTGVAASYMIDCLTTPYFRALNTSVTAKQAELPFEMAMGWIEGNPRLEHLIEDISLRPYPTIKFKNFSEWVFRTAGKDGRFIRGMEFDRINYDEAGLDFSGDAPESSAGALARREAGRDAADDAPGRDDIAHGGAVAEGAFFPRVEGVYWRARRRQFGGLLFAADQHL